MELLLLPVIIIFSGLSGVMFVKGFVLTLFLPLCLSAAILIWLAVKIRQRDEKLSKRWTIVCEDVYDHVVYRRYNYLTHSGAMVHTTDDVGVMEMEVTAIHFADGRSCILKGHWDMQFPKGTLIRVLGNGLGRRRIKKVESR